jgi:hypothetical protein
MRLDKKVYYLSGGYKLINSESLKIEKLLIGLICKFPYISSYDLNKNEVWSLKLPFEMMYGIITT